MAMASTVFMPWIVCLLVIVINIKHTYSAWVVPSQDFPRNDDEICVGSYNGKIFIIGGYDYPSSLLEYDPTTQTFTDHGFNGLSGVQSGGDGQFWTQQGSILYMIRDRQNPSSFNTFDMSLNLFTTDWKGITFPVAVDEACLASTETFLYVLGGTLDVLQILSLSTYTWLSNPPSMIDTREKHACIVHNGFLWTFGGRAPTGNALNRNERIEITDITQKTWNSIDPLTCGVEYTRAVALHNVIYIIGGQKSSDNELDLVHFVDANSGAVALSDDRMPWVGEWQAPIMVDGTIYNFGGYRGDTREWSYYPIISVTNNPTAPTKYPSAAPITASPTPHPTASPVTTAPTEHPSASPSTTSPTEHPSAAPTTRPTVPPLLTCGQQASGDYNDQIVEFDVRLPYNGDLTFDASSSAIAIQSLTAVFGVTPIGSDTNYDGILTISDAIA
eukprot:518025_1